tara:strand:+ start:8562 stop:9632 length:1071 start_codon:yes stop_codon:yes gene_type:complete
VARKRIKKDKVKYKLGDGISEVSYKGDDALTAWNEWVEKAKGISGEAMGVQMFSGSLYEMLAQHGIAPRIMGNSGPKETPGLGKELEALNTLFNKPDFSAKELETLVAIINIIRNHGKKEGDLNPRNIRFDGIDKIKRAAKTATKKPVYGHYRTPKYVMYRRVVRGKDEQDAVDTTWFSNNKGEAMPPMWQAIYGDGSSAPFDGVNGLYDVLGKGYKMLHGAEHHITKEGPVKIEQQGAAEKAYSGIGEIKAMMNAMVKDDEFTTSKGNFATTRARTRLMSVPISTHSNAESKTVKALLGAIEQPGRIDDFYIYISRRQVNHMAKLAGWKPPEKEEVKTSADIEIRDWRTVMKVMA